MPTLGGPSLRSGQDPRHRPTLALRMIRLRERHRLWHVSRWRETGLPRLRQHVRVLWSFSWYRFWNSLRPARRPQSVDCAYPRSYSRAARIPRSPFAIIWSNSAPTPLANHMGPEHHHGFASTSRVRRRDPISPSANVGLSVPVRRFRPSHRPARSATTLRL
jgi:hypothetical protein